MSRHAEGLARRLRRAVARPVPGPGDRWLPTGGTHEWSRSDAADLHAQGALPGGIDGFLAAAAPAPPRPEGVLELGGLRFDVATTGGVAAGVLRGRRGRPLRGPGGLLDLPRHRGVERPGRRTLRVDAPVAVLDLRARSAENYFHLHVDALVNRWLIAQAMPDIDDARWLVPLGPAAWQAEALSLAGLAADVVDLVGVDRVVAPRFLVPVRGLGSRSVPDWAVTALRDIAGPVATHAGHGRLLHVARTDATRRRVRGEEDLAGHLAVLGFTTVTLTGMTVAEQRARFAAADVIVAAHGAALTNLAWARPGAAVLELLPAARPNLAYRRLAVQAGVRHVGLICPPGDDVADAHGDVSLDIPVALRLVEDLLAAA